ncbi:MAG: MFS transporter [Candidatus Latescibacteria bacterium]|nr:MFS transporter [Candidatus Latescibacterota bacterium]
MEPWRKNLYVIWGAQFLAMAGMSMAMPFMPFYIRTLGVTELASVKRWSGVVFAGPFLVSVFMAPVWGLVSDRYSRKLMVVRAFLGIALATGLMGFAQSVTQLFLLRMLQGGFSGFMSASVALVSTTTPKERMGYSLGFLQTSTATGSVVGPLMGGVLADLVGYRAIFFITSGLALGSAVVVSLAASDGPKGDGRGKKFTLRDNYRFVWETSIVWKAMIVMFLAQLCTMLVQPIFALYIESMWPYSRYLSTATGAIFAVTGVATALSAPRWGRYSDQRGYGRTLTFTTVGAGLVYALQGVVTHPFIRDRIRGLNGLNALQQEHSRAIGIGYLSSDQLC